MQTCGKVAEACEHGHPTSVAHPPPLSPELSFATVIFQALISEVPLDLGHVTQ